MNRRWAILAGLMLWSSQGWTDPEAISLATSLWPPYNDASLPGQGMNTELVRLVFARMGITLFPRFLPYERAMLYGLNEPGFLGYFPEYKSSQVLQRCLLSDPIGESPLVLARRVDFPFQYDQPASMLSYSVGVVSGYTNVEEFDRNVANGLQRVEFAKDDEANLYKLLFKREDLAIIDSRVMDWLLTHSDKLKPYARMLVKVEPVLDMQPLYVCFRPNLQGRQLQQRFNAALKGLDVERFNYDYLLQHAIATAIR